MKKVVLFLSLLMTSALWASVDLKVGDVLLQPLDCWSCDLIEDEEQSIYSHMGIVVSVEPVMVADSRRKVEVQTLKEFDSITQKGQALRVLRFRNEKILAHFEENSEEFLRLFMSEFDGLPYDHDFLCNNLTENGSEKLYCSEMVAKLLQKFLGIQPPMKRMHFSRNYDRWLQYFRGNVPVGKWGNSPADFERSDLFYAAGDL